MNYSRGLRVRPASRRGSPIYSANPFTPCRRPYSGGSDDCLRQYLPRRFCLRHFRTDSATTSPTDPEPMVRVTKLQRSLYATAWMCCKPCSGQDLYDQAFMGRVTPEAHVGYHWMVHCHLPSPDFHRLDWQPYGLRTEITETKPAKPDRNRTQDNYALEQLDQQRARGLEHLHTLREIRGRGLCANLRSRAKAHLAVILKPLNPARSECGDIPARKTPIYAGAFLNFVMI